MTTKKFFLLSALVLGVSAAANAADCTVTNTNDAGAGSLRQCLADVSSGGTITVPTALSGQTIVLTTNASTSNQDGNSAFVVNKNFTLNGNGIILDGNNVRRHFFNNGTAYRVTFNDVHFTNGKAKWGGSVQNNNGTSIVIFNNCVFSNNTSEGGDNVGGGAIHVNNQSSSDKVSLIVNHCLFINNTAKFRGGAIEIYKCLNGSSITNCIFLGNRATKSQDGNSIYCGDNNMVTSGGGNIFDYPAVGNCFSFNGANDAPVPPGTDAFTWNIGTPNASDVTASYSFAQKTLTITGTGDMRNFHQDSVPWAVVKAMIYIAVIRGSVHNIGNNAFKNCYQLRQVRLPQSDVNTIGANAFTGCNLLTHIFLMRDQPPLLNTTAFDGLNKSGIGVFVPTPNAYMSNAEWSGFGITSAY